MTRPAPALPTLPTIGTSKGLDALRAEPARWTPHVTRIAEQLGLAGRPLRDLGGGNLVVALGDEHVLKLTPPVFAREVLGETAALDALAGRAWPEPLRAPELLGRGTHEGWPWVLLRRLPGETLRACRARIPEADRVDIARRLGEWLAKLHAAPRPVAPRLEGSWVRYLETNAPGAVARQERWGVPAAVCAEMTALLARTDLLGSDSTLLHADLHDDNVLVEQRGGRFVATGVIDFGDATAGDPLFDLVTPVALVARGDGRVVRALFEGAGFPDALDDPALIDRFLALSVVHRWNDLTRIGAWAPDAMSSLDALARGLLGTERPR